VPRAGWVDIIIAATSSDAAVRIMSTIRAVSSKMASRWRPCSRERWFTPKEGVVSEDDRVERADRHHYGSSDTDRPLADDSYTASTTRWT
jgi:hypothetical protein